MNDAPRRVVTGIGEDGRSCVIIDGPLQPSDVQISSIWHTRGVPADNSGAEDCPLESFSFDKMHSGGTIFLHGVYPPGAGVEPYWHATDTIDYIVILKGEIVLELEAGEVRVKAGDFLVNRGVIHSWRNDTSEPAETTIVIIPAEPVGKGRTV